MDIPNLAVATSTAVCVDAMVQFGCFWYSIEVRTDRDGSPHRTSFRSTNGSGGEVGSTLSWILFVSLKEQKRSISKEENVCKGEQWQEIKGLEIGQSCHQNATGRILICQSTKGCKFNGGKEGYSQNDCKSGWVVNSTEQEETTCMAYTNHLSHSEKALEVQTSPRYEIISKQHNLYPPQCLGRKATNLTSHTWQFLLLAVPPCTGC